MRSDYLKDGPTIRRDGGCLSLWLFRSCCAVVLALPLVAKGQTQVIYDCIEGLDTSVSIGSADGTGFRQDAYQILLAQEHEYFLRELSIIMRAENSNGLFAEPDYTGRVVLVKGRVGTVDQNAVFTPDPAFTPFEIPFTIQLGQIILVAGGQFPIWELPLNFGGPSAPKIPAGKALHVAVVGLFDEVPDGERLGVLVSTTCLQSTSGYIEQIEGPAAPLVGFIDSFGIGTGRIAMRVTVEPFGAPIPTVSEWGLVAMTLLMMTVGTLVCRSRMGKPVGVRERNGGWGAG